MSTTPQEAPTDANQAVRGAARRRPHRGGQGRGRPGGRRLRPARRAAVRRPRADGGGAGGGQDPARAHPGRRPRRAHPARAVHPRPDARRHHRARWSSTAAGRADLPRGADLHQPAAGRRDQPHAAQDPVRPARGDGGGHRDGGRRRTRCRGRSSWRATQNPVEYEGTYPLPEAQLDRFLLKVVLPAAPAQRRAGDPAPARGRVRPETRGRGRRTPGRRPRRHRRGRGGGETEVTVSPEVARLHRRHRPRHPGVAVGEPRGLPAWCDGPDARPAGPGPGSSVATSSPPTT